MSSEGGPREEGDRRESPWRLLLYSSWVLLSAVPTLIAGAALAISIANAGYDAHENRAPEARIAFAAIATAVGLAAVSVAVQRLRGRRGGLWPITGPLLTVTSALLVVLWWAVTILTGPL